MEDFGTENNKNIKEKNLYILHLDTPRIIILSAVLFGIIVISLLTGMNINKKDQRDNNIFSEDNAVFDTLISENNIKSNSLQDNIIESPLDKEISLKNFNSQSNGDPFLSPNSAPVANDLILSKKNIFNSSVPNNFNSNVSKAPEILGATDILTHENIETIIPPANILKKSVPKKYLKKPTRKNTAKKRNKKKKKNVVEVSSAKKAYSAPKTKKSYYSIQVASFDKRSKALSEINNLGDMKYNAYIEKSKVKGKTYYRVRIGPIYSRRKACHLLDEVAEDNRYEESYIIKK